MLTQHPSCQRALFYLLLSIVPDPLGDMNQRRAAARLAVDKVLASPLLSGSQQI